MVPKVISISLMIATVLSLLAWSKAEPPHVETAAHSFDENHDRDHDRPLAGTSEDVERNGHLATITKLQSRLSELDRDLQSQREAKDLAIDAFHRAMVRRNTEAARAQDVSEERRSLEKDLFDTRTQQSEHAASLSGLRGRAARAREAIKTLEGRGRAVLREQTHLLNDFRTHGLETWAVSHSLPGTGALVHAVEPVIEQLNTQLPGDDDDEYIGLVANFALLAPIVLALSAALRGGATITAASAYFAFASAACVIRPARAVLLAGVLGFVHAAAFLTLLTATVLAAVRSRHRDAVLHAALLLAAGTHAAASAPRPVGPVAYAAYAVAFAVVAVQRSGVASLLIRPKQDGKTHLLEDYIPIEKPVKYTFGHALEREHTAATFDVEEQCFATDEGDTSKPGDPQPRQNNRVIGSVAPLNRVVLSSKGTEQDIHVLKVL